MVKKTNAYDEWAKPTWFSGDKPTTPDYYVGLRKAKETDPVGAQEASYGFGAWQADPNSEYYAPYLYNMTNTKIADNIYNIGLELGAVWDISKGVNQADIDFLGSMADWSNKSIDGTPNNSGTAQQRLAYNVYKLQQDEEITAKAEAEMHEMNEYVNALVSRGYSDTDIVKMTEGRYPTLAKITESAKQHLATPLNRALGYSDDYIFGSIWNARNNADENTFNAIANFAEGAGTMYKPDAAAEAARNPASENYHPYAQGATLNWLDSDTYPESGKYDQAWLDANKESMFANEETRKAWVDVNDAHVKTEKAKAQLSNLQTQCRKLLASGYTPEQVYEYVFGNDMENLSEEYPILQKMEIARRNGTYIFLTDSVDFAEPYFKQWLEDEASGKNTEGKSLWNVIFGDDFVSAEKEKTDYTFMPTYNTEWAEANPTFDVLSYSANTPAYEDLKLSLHEYRRGAAVANADAVAFIEKYPYLFGGDITTTSPGGHEAITMDTRSRTKSRLGIFSDTPIGDTAFYNLLVKADEAQKNGYITQDTYEQFLIGMAQEIESAGGTRNGIKNALDNSDSTQSRFADYWNGEINEANQHAAEETQKQRIEMAVAGEEAFKQIQNGTLRRDMTEEEAEKYGYTQKGVEAYFHAYDELHTGTFDENKMKSIDEKGYRKQLITGLEDKVTKEFAYSSFQTKIDDELRNGIITDTQAETLTNDALRFIEARVNTQLLIDAKTAYVFGVPLDAYYNSKGFYGSDKGYAVKNNKEGYNSLESYRDGLIAQAIEEYEVYSSLLDEDMASIYRTMTEYENDPDSWYNLDAEENVNGKFKKDRIFTDDEINSAIEHDVLTEDEATRLRQYEKAREYTYSIDSNPDMNKEFFEKRLDNGKDDEANEYLREKMNKYLAHVAEGEYGVWEKGVKDDSLLIGTETYGDGASVGYVVVSGVDLGLKQHALSWTETYYAFARGDDAQVEEKYRTRYSREEVRKNIENAIQMIKDPGLRNAVYEQYYYFDGDIYDFNFDFTTLEVKNSITNQNNNIEFLKSEMKDVMTQSQYETAESISSATNSLLYSGETLILGVAMGGSPIAQFASSVFTTGLNSYGNVVNSVMDAGGSKKEANKGAIPAMFVNAGIEALFDTNLSPLGLRAEFTNISSAIRKTLSETASDGFMKTLSKLGYSGTLAVMNSAIENAGIIATNQAFEVVGEVAQEATERMAVNKALAAEEKWDQIDELTWDEVSEIMEDSFKSGLIQAGVGGTLRTTNDFINNNKTKHKQQQEIVRTLIHKDTLTGLEAKQFKEALDALSEDEYAEQYIAEAVKEAEYDQLVVEKMGERKEEITSMPEFEQRNDTKEALQAAALETIQASEKLEQAERECKAASEQLASEDIPSPETIEMVSEAQEQVKISNEKYEELSKREEEAAKLLNELDEAVKAKEKEWYNQITKEAKQELKAKYEAEIKAAFEAKKQAELEAFNELKKNEREKLLRELEEDGYSKRQIQKADEYEQKHYDKYTEKEVTQKEKLLNDIKAALPAYTVKYDYSNDDAAGWVVREGENGEFVLNGNMDYDTLSGSVAAHELVHVAEDSGVYNELSDTVKAIMFDGDQQKEQKAVEQIKKEYAKDGIVLSDEQAFHEVIAESVQDMFRGRTEWVKRIVNEKPNLATRIFDWVKNKVDEMKLLYKEGQEAAKTYRSLVKVRKLLSDAIRDAGQRIEKASSENTEKLAFAGKPPVLKESNTTVSEAVTEDAGKVTDNAETAAETAFTEAETANATDAEQMQTEEEKPEAKTVSETVKEAKLRIPKENTSLVKEEEVSTETKVDTEYEGKNTPEEEKLLEEAKKDEDEYMSATDDDLMKSGGDIELSDGVEQVESNTRDTFGLMNKKTVADDWSAFAVEKLGWSAAKDKINGYAQSIGFGGEQDMFRTSLLIPIEWFVERGLGEEGYTADTHKAAAQEFMLEQPEAYEHMIDVLDGKTEQEIATEQTAEQTEETFSAMEELSDETDESANKNAENENNSEESANTSEETSEDDGLTSMGMKRSEMKGHSSYEYALKRRINASERARKAARLLRNSEYFRENGMWAEYAKTVAERFGLGDLNVKATTPDVALKQLASNLGIAVYDSGFMAGIKEFAAYDKRASSLLTNNKAAANDFASYAFAIGEKLKELTGITDLKEDYTVADFVNDYLLRDESEFGNELKAYAKEFKAKLTEAGKEFVQALDDARDQIKNFSIASAVDKMEAFLVSRSERKQNRDWIRNTIIGVIDQTYSAEIVDQLTGSHELRKAAAYLPYAKRRAERILTGDSFVDVDGNRTGEDTLKTALESIKESEKNDFQMFLFAREVLDRYNMGKAPFTENGGMTKSIAEQTLAELTKKYPHFEEAGERYNAWWDNFMQTYMVREGFISPEDYQRMSQAHPNYVSLAREVTGSYKIMGAKGNSDLRVYYPLENAIGMVQQFVNKVMQNRFARVFDELYNNNDDLGVIAMQLPVAKESIIKRNYDDALKFFMDMDDKSDTVKASSNTGDLLTVYRADGSIVQYDVRDRALFELLSGLSAVRQQEALKVAGVAYKVLSFVTGTMSKLTTGINPLFIGKNIIRDFQKSVNYGSWATTYADGLLKWIPAWFDIAFEVSDTAKDYIALGGGEWERLNVNTTKGVKKYEQELFTKGRSIKQLEGASKLKRIVHNATTGLLDFFGSTTEAASRYVEYKYGKHDLATAAGRQEAFMAAQEATVDFQRGGKYAKWIKAFVPFANATIQGTVQNVRMFTDAEKARLKPRLQKMAFNNMLMGAASAIMCWHLGSEEDKRKYEEMSEDYKQNFILIPLPEELGKEYISLPVSQDWFSRLFYEFGRRCATGEIVDEGIGRDMVSLAWGIVSEVATETTTIASPFFDVLKNEEWNGSPVVKDSLLNYAPEGRYDVTTAGIFKNASRGLVQMLRKWGVDEDSKLYDFATPLALEYLAQQYTGVYGQLIIPAISPEKYTGNGKNILRSLADTTASKFSLDADTYNIVTDRFYEICDKVTEMSAYIDNERSYAVNPNLSDEELKRIFDEVASSDNKGGIIYNAREVNKECLNKISAILMRNDLTEHEKRVLTEEQYEIRNAAFREVLEWFDPIELKVSGNTYRAITGISNAEKRFNSLDSHYKAEYDSGEAYMLEAVRLANLPENANKSSTLPIPNYAPTRTIDKVSYTYDLNKDFAKYMDGYNDVYAEAYRSEANKILMNASYKMKNDEEKTQLFSKADSKANEAAKEWLWKQIDTGIAKTKGKAK